MRTAIHWMTRLFISLRASDDERQDAEDWLAGREAAIVDRRNERAYAAILAMGGEIA